MASYVKIRQFVEDICNKVHDLANDTLTVGLTTNGNIPLVTNSVLADLTPISYTNLSTLVLSTVSSTQTTGTYTLVLTDLVLTASGAVATFRHVFIYNDTPSSPANPLICFFDYGSDVTLADGETFTIDFGASLFSLA